jgi:ribose-phosphate pyrophosphokinase
MLNLHDIPVANFPDGHKHLIVPDDFECPPGDMIKASLRSFDDLFLLAQAKQIFPHLKKLYISYLLGARCDRRFSSGEAHDLSIVAEMINRMAFEEVMVLKPHSPVAENLIGNMVACDLTASLLSKCERENNLPEYGIVSPDKGASAWIADYVRPRKLDRCGPVNTLIQCDKQRDMTAEHRGIGKIVVPDLPEGIKDFVIVDDLCDGGGTFLGIASQLRERGAERVFLIVIHSILSKGVDVFDGLIDKIYTTNSFADFNHPNVFQENVQ